MTAPPSYLRNLLYAVFAAYVGYIAWAYADGFRKAERGERPLFNDFTSSYGASLLLRELPPEFLYHDTVMTAATSEAGNAAYGGTLNEKQSKVGFVPWMYPPTFIALVMPLAALPYFWAMLAWLGMTAIPYLAATRAILAKAPGSMAMALAAPPFFHNAMFGQVSLMPAGLIGLGLHCLRQRPVIAGVLIGLVSVKPHLGLLLPFALAAGGYWRTFWSAAATVITMIVASVIFFGMEPWRAFVGSFGFYFEGFQHGGYAWRYMTSVLSVSHLSGIQLDLAWQIQSFFTVASILLVSFVWMRSRRRDDLDLLCAAILCFAIPFSIPAIYLYDLVVLVPGFAFFWQDLRHYPAQPWELPTAAMALACLLLVPLGALPWLPLGVLAIAVLLGLATRRFFIRAYQPPFIVTMKGSHH